MSDQLPRKRIDPLPPPPGQLDRVLGQARYRRHRRAMAVLSVALVFVAGLGGGLALGRDVPQRIISAANDAVGDHAPATTSAPKHPAASRTPNARPKHRAQPLATKLSSGQGGAYSYRGRAVGPAGQPASGLYIYVGVPGATGFVPAGDALGVTAADGSFSMACPKAPVLLAPWPINAEAKSKARAVGWGATFVGGATRPVQAGNVPCTRSKKAVDVTTVLRGSAVEGTVSMPPECRKAELGLWVWLGNDRDVHVNVQALRDGDTFRVGGLPAGEHTLGANGNQYRVRLGDSGTVHQDVLFSCDGTRSRPSSPSESATPEPTPTETATVIPSLPTGTSTSTSTSTTTSSPSPSASETP